MIHRNNPKHEVFRFDIQSEMATETEFKTLVYNPQNNKLDPKTINGYYFGYSIGSRVQDSFANSHHQNCGVGQGCLL